jgi:AcrR family transcriptional regulator
VTRQELADDRAASVSTTGRAGYAKGVQTETPKRGRGRPSRGVREAILATTLGLIEEQGLARLTTKAIARRAGVSEASIYYHFADKPALIEGVIFEAVLGPLREFASSFQARAAGKPVRSALLEYGRALEAFWVKVLPVLSAVQGDAELRERFQGRINELGLGPHRGVNAISTYLAEQQRVGTVRPQVDPQAAAMSFASACFLSAYQRHMLGAAARRKLPSLNSVLTTLSDLLTTR